jgi:hypothetical protein
MLGRRGIELINKATDKKSGIVEWLQNVWSEIRKMLNIFELSNENLLNLNLKEYVNLVNISLLNNDFTIERLIEMKLIDRVC